MGTSIRTFTLPRKTLLTPRQFARKLTSLPKPEPEIEMVDPLAGWMDHFTTDAAEAALLTIGGKMPIRPATDPDMPDDITAISGEHLGALYGHYVAYVEWLEAQLALAEMYADEKQAFLEHVEAEVRLRKSGTVQDKSAKAKNDVRYVQEEQAMLTAKAIAKLLKARVRGYERCASALSREMTRRTPGNEHT